MKITKDKIQSYIPQRDPFVMVDNLIDATKEKFETNFFISSNNIFLEGNVLREFALIENMAQSTAVGIFFLNMYSGYKPVEGFLAAISKLRVYALPNVEDTIYTIITPLYQFANMHLIKGEIFLNGNLLLESEIKLAGK